MVAQGQANEEHYECDAELSGEYEQLDELCDVDVGRTAAIPASAKRSGPVAMVGVASVNAASVCLRSFASSIFSGRQRELPPDLL